VWVGLISYPVQFRHVKWWVWVECTIVCSFGLGLIWFLVLAHRQVRTTYHPHLGQQAKLHLLRPLVGVSFLSIDWRHGPATGTPVCTRNEQEPEAPTQNWANWMVRFSKLDCPVLSGSTTVRGAAGIRQKSLSFSQAMSGW
jgi:hypothetical protein